MTIECADSLCWMELAKVEDIGAFIVEHAVAAIMFSMANDNPGESYPLAMEHANQVAIMVQNLVQHPKVLRQLGAWKNDRVERLERVMTNHEPHGDN